MFFSSDTTHMVVQDTVKQSGSGGDWILHHVMDGNYLDFEPFGKIYLPHLQLLGLDISITRHVVFPMDCCCVVNFNFYNSFKRL